MTIRELIDELRAASDIVGPDADVEHDDFKIESVRTGVRSAFLEVKPFENDELFQKIKRLEEDVREGDDRERELKDAVENAIDEIENKIDPAVILGRLKAAL